MQRKHILINPANPQPEHLPLLREILLNLDHEHRIEFTTTDIHHSPTQTAMSTNDIICRRRKNGYDLRYEILASTPLAKGGYAQVREILGTIEIDASNNILIKKHKKRIVKEEAIKSLSVQREAELIKLAEDEAILSQSATYLHSKPLTIKRSTGTEPTKTYLVMKFLGKNSLSTLLSADETDTQGIATLTTQQRYDLTLALLKAYRAQVKQSGLIHRDIKPDNILVEQHDKLSFSVNFIDYGLGKKNTTNDALQNKSYGNLLYMAPEALASQGTTESTDLYSLGMIIAQIWRANSDFGFTDAIDLKIKKGNPNFVLDISTIFSKLTDPTAKERAEIIYLITLLTHTNPKSRIGLAQAIYKADCMRINYIKSFLTEIETLELDKVRSHALDLRDSLDHLPNISSSSLLLYKKVVNEHLDKIGDSKIWLDEFIITAELDIPLARCQSKEEIKQYIDTMIFSLNDRMLQVGRLAERLALIEKAYHDKCKHPSRGKTENILLELTHKCHDILYKSDRPLSIENIVRLSDSYQRVIDRITKTMETQTNHAKDVATRVLFALDVNPTNSALISLKNALLESMLTYLSDAQSPSNSYYHPPAISDTRANEIGNILNHIKSAQSLDTLINTVSRATDTLETGWLGRSRLRDNIMDILSRQRLVHGFLIA